jgi:hypothetical protein
MAETVASNPLDTTQVVVELCYKAGCSEDDYAVVQSSRKVTEREARELIRKRLEPGYYWRRKS